MSLADWLCLISPSLSFFFSFPKRRVFSCLKRDFFLPVEDTRNQHDCLNRSPEIEINDVMRMSVCEVQSDLVLSDVIYCICVTCELYY